MISELKKNISLQELADKANIDIKTIKGLGFGKYYGYGIPQYIKIADALGVSPEEITKGQQFVDD